MNLQLMKNEVYLKQWSSMVQECQSSGLTVNAWCEGQGIKPKTYYYRLKKVREAVCQEIGRNPHRGNEEPVFAEVTKFCERNGDAITIQMAGIEIRIQNGAEADVIETTLRALKRIC